METVGWSLSQCNESLDKVKSRPTRNQSLWVFCSGNSGIEVISFGNPEERIVPGSVNLSFSFRISGRGVIIRDSEKPAIFCEMLTIPLSFRGSEIDKYIFRNPGIKNFFTGNPVMAPLLPLSLEKQRQFWQYKSNSWNFLKRRKPFSRIVHKKVVPWCFWTFVIYTKNIKSYIIP